MYHVGFGDSFLLSLPRAKGGHDHLLIDFGVHPQGDAGVLEQVLADIETETGKSLAVIIATHEHQDHIAGFARFPKRFAGIEVGEVWMPWLSDPDDSRAAALRRKKKKLAEALAARLAADGAAGYAVLNARGNDASMQVLREGLGGHPRLRYLASGGTLNAPAGIDGLVARILGPPEDEALLAKMNPPTGHHYLIANGAPARKALEPFPRWTKQRQLDAKEEKAVRANLANDAEDLAFALDSAINNTSVVALLTFRGENHLFAGDAQWGNWKGWIEDDAGKELLGKVSFYKVAHHGSYNATPSEALEGMPAGRFVAMMSTQSTPWPSIPRPQLVTRLLEATRQQLARSDQAKPPSKFARFALGTDYLVKV
jgi:beta-lactamase superfamily II metal-dependent hydrolase